MAKKNKIQLPQSTAGLVRYFEESQEAIKLKPQHIVIICVLILTIEIALKIMMS